MFSDYGFILPSMGYIATEHTIRTKRRALQTFVTVVTRAWHEIYDQDKANDAVAAIIKNRPQAKLDPANLLAQIELYRPYFYTPATKGKPLAWQSQEDWAAAIATMQKVGLIRAGAKVQDFYTNEFFPN